VRAEAAGLIRQRRVADARDQAVRKLPPIEQELLREAARKPPPAPDDA
jgi:hypothetical protein